MFPLSLYFLQQQVKWSAKQLWNNIAAHYCTEESALVDQLLALVDPDEQKHQKKANGWLTAIQTNSENQRYFDQFLKDFSLNNEEAILLFSLAEILLNASDQQKTDALIADKLNSDQWQRYVNASNSILLNSDVWTQALNQQLIAPQTQPKTVFNQLIERLSHEVIRKALTQAMAHLKEPFIFSPDIQAGLTRLHAMQPNQTCTFSILKDTTVTGQDAKRSFSAYLQAIEGLAAQNIEERPAASVSIKLSALHPRFEPLKSETVIDEVLQRVLHLLIIAKTENVPITFDAEESCRLELTLQVFEAILRSGIGKDWNGLGITVQAYSKRALPVLAWLSFIAEELQTTIPVRLVKGAYWHTEIKLAQQQGLSDYPVYSLQQATDLSYQVCAQYLLSEQCPRLKPQFASHNTSSISQVIGLSKLSSKPFELQRIHGLGEALYKEVMEQHPDASVRIYAPIGIDQQRLPFFIQQQLGNSANSAFILPPVGSQMGPEQLTTSVQQLQQAQEKRNPTIPLPGDLYQPIRENSAGVILDSQKQLTQLLEQLKPFMSYQWQACALINGEQVKSQPEEVAVSPFDLHQKTGQLFNATPDDVREAFAVTRAGFINWNNRPVTERAMIIKRFALLLEEHRGELIALCMREAGKPLKDAINEIREAIDSCYYYAHEAVTRLINQSLPSVTGEENILSYEGRGTFVCISPWNFPLAIWAGQVVAALLAGNAVIAKPAHSTPLIAYRATQLLLDAGVPKDAIALLPGRSQEIGSQLTSDFRLSGVAFTGSNRAAKEIAKQLTLREGTTIIPFVAKTGGRNAMIVDNTALPEQVVKEVIASAFNSAGQRCSALKVLYLQEETADKIEAMIIGAILAQKVGTPYETDTDIGPIINNNALQALYDHIEHCREHGRLLFEAELKEQQSSGYFVAPALIRLFSIDELNDEHFGPVLHIIRYQTDNIDRIIEEINRTEHGLTLGIHSKDEQIIKHICTHTRVDNLYINRNQIGSITSSQPFGIMGRSGTGPKASGPNYLMSFAQEKTCSTNISVNGIK